jgi:carbon monoxide dehydrogenase subunit G
MATITREITLDATPDAVWEKLRDVGAINELIDFLGEVTVEGDRRACALDGGGELEELIVTVDDEARRVAYSIVESPFGFAHHGASMQALANGNGGTRFLWVSDFKPDDVEPALAEAVDGALASIERALS